MNKPSNVIEYMAMLSEQDRKALELVRLQILLLVPSVDEKLSRGVPFFYYKDKRAIGFRASKGYLSFFIMEGNVLKSMKKELFNYESSSTVVWFTPSKPLTRTLIKKMVLSRVKEIDDNINVKQKRNGSS